MTRAKRPAAAGTAPTEVVEVVIETLGSRGDGVAHIDGTPVFVPFVLPGERVRVRITGRRGDGLAGEPLAWLSDVARVEPPCPHFGVCGGCQLQHLPEEAYLAWLCEQIRAALVRRGLGATPLEPPLMTPAASRRRVRLAFARRGGGVRLGFRARATHEITDLAVCRVVVPAIEALIAPLRRLLVRLDPAIHHGEIEITHAASGIDLLVRTRGAPSLADREELAAFAADVDLARLCWQMEGSAAPEPIVARRPVMVELEGVVVELPPGAFLQASLEAEAGIRAGIREALGDAGRVADLFAGCGTFALPLADEGRRVVAIERDGAMLDALVRAARAAGSGSRLTAERRDLERRPLAGAELDGLDAVVLDPPRAGARAQAQALAGSAAARIAMASCNPASFARDARILVDGGLELLWVRPVDAFLWSAELELVAAFARRIPS